MIRADVSGVGLKHAGERKGGARACINMTLHDERASGISNFKMVKYIKKHKMNIEPEMIQK